MTSSAECNQGTWQPLKNQPNFVSYDLTDPNNPIATPGGAWYPRLLTDGSVLVQNTGYYNTNEMWRLIPDDKGSYVNGTFKKIAPMPYTPLYYGSAVLADGRVIVLGGEYTGWDEQFTITNEGAIYDPAQDTWTSITGPLFFTNFYPTLGHNQQSHPVGDAATVVLEDGTFMVHDKLSKQSAIWNPKTSPLPTWTEVGTATKQYMNGEEGWVLLPPRKKTTCEGTEERESSSFWGLLGGNIAKKRNQDKERCKIKEGVCEVLTVNTFAEYEYNHKTHTDTFPFPFDTMQSEIYNPLKQTWRYGGNTKTMLPDASPYPLWDAGFSSAFELGAPVLRPDGTVFVTGGSGNTAFFDSTTRKWRAGPRLPSKDASEYQLGCQDAPGVLLTNGNVLFAASPIYPDYNPPVHFFVLDARDDKLIEQPNIPNATLTNPSLLSPDPAYSINLLMLPTGQVLEMDSSNDVQIYTPNDLTWCPEWEPIITRVKSTLKAGQTFKIKGIRFNGMSQCSMYGDDFQMATNYPLVRLTNVCSKAVTYCRTHDHSYMGVQSDRIVKTFFDVPSDISVGYYNLEVVANGIPSKSRQVQII